jgi:hypothetical protein
MAGTYLGKVWCGELAMENPSRSLKTIGYHDLEFNVHWDVSKESAPSVCAIYH